MFWAEHEVGLPTALKKLRDMADSQKSPFMKVSRLLEKLVADGKGFACIGNNSDERIHA